MTMRMLGLLVVAALLAIPSGASAQDVNNDWDKGFDFSKLRTFAIKMGTSWGNQLSENRVMGDIAEALTERGWRQVPEAMADATVVLHGATEKKRNLNTFYDGWGGWGWSSMGTSTTTVSEYTVGTLLVDIFDNSSKKLVFRGRASDELSKDPSKNERKSEKAAQKMFKAFPPKATE